MWPEPGNVSEHPLMIIKPATKKVESQGDKNQKSNICQWFCPHYRKVRSWFVYLHNAYIWCWMPSHLLYFVIRIYFILYYVFCFYNLCVWKTKIYIISCGSKRQMFLRMVQKLLIASYSLFTRYFLQFFKCAITSNNIYC